MEFIGSYDYNKLPKWNLLSEILVILIPNLNSFTYENFVMSPVFRIIGFYF